VNICTKYLHYSSYSAYPQISPEMIKIMDILAQYFFKQLEKNCERKTVALRNVFYAYKRIVNSETKYWWHNSSFLSQYRTFISDIEKYLLPKELYSELLTELKVWWCTEKEKICGCLAQEQLLCL